MSEFRETITISHVTIYILRYIEKVPHPQKHTHTHTTQNMKQNVSYDLLKTGKIISKHAEEKSFFSIFFLNINMKHNAEHS
jgi:hypothetical protein